MEPITTTALIAGLISLAKAALMKGSEKVGEAGAKAAMEAWPKVKSLLGLTTDPAPAKLDDEIGKAVYTKPEVHEQLRQLLKEHKQASAVAVVGSIVQRDGQIIVADEISGSVNTNLAFGKS